MNPAKRVENIFKNSGYGIIRRFALISGYLPVAEQFAGAYAGASSLLPLQHGQPHGGFDFGYVVTDL